MSAVLILVLPWVNCLLLWSWWSRQASSSLAPIVAHRCAMYGFERKCFDQQFCGPAWLHRTCTSRKKTLTSKVEYQTCSHKCWVLWLAIKQTAFPGHGDCSRAYVALWSPAILQNLHVLCLPLLTRGLFSYTFFRKEDLPACRPLVHKVWGKTGKPSSDKHAHFLRRERALKRWRN